MPWNSSCRGFCLSQEVGVTQLQYLRDFKEFSSGYFTGLQILLYHLCFQNVHKSWCLTRLILSISTWTVFFLSFLFLILISFYHPSLGEKNWTVPSNCKLEMSELYYLNLSSQSSCWFNVPYVSFPVGSVISYKQPCVCTCVCATPIGKVSDVMRQPLKNILQITANLQLEHQVFLSSFAKRPTQTLEAFFIVYYKLLIYTQLKAFIIISKAIEYWQEHPERPFPTYSITEIRKLQPRRSSSVCMSSFSTIVISDAMVILMVLTKIFQFQLKFQCMCLIIAWHVF